MGYPSTRDFTHYSDFGAFTKLLWGKWDVG